MTLFEFCLRENAQKGDDVISNLKNVMTLEFGSLEVLVSECHRTPILDGFSLSSEDLRNISQTPKRRDVVTLFGLCPRENAQKRDDVISNLKNAMTLEFDSLGVLVSECHKTSV